MVPQQEIYTKTGDEGTTALDGAECCAKHDLRIEAYGTVDEANAAIGLAEAELTRDDELDAVLARIQNDLFDLGAELATPDAGKPKDYEPLRIVAAQMERLERDIDRLNAELQPLRSFVLPGRSRAAAALHLARTIARCAERLMVALAEKESEEVTDAALIHMNRLSDFLFLASRWVNRHGAGDVLRVPGKNR
jgi:cob(I)alamin adenosyltransferase